MFKKIAGGLISLIGLLGTYSFIVMNNSYIFGLFLLVVTISFFVEMFKNKKFNSFDFLAALIILGLFVYSIYSTPTLCCGI